MNETLENDEVEDDSAKFVDVSVTMDHLRRDDENWQQIRNPKKGALVDYIKSRIAYFTDKPYIEYETDSIADYTKRFFRQPQGFGWSLDFDPNFFCEGRVSDVSWDHFFPFFCEFGDPRELPKIEPEGVMRLKLGPKRDPKMRFSAISIKRQILDSFLIIFHQKT